MEYNDKLIPLTKRLCSCYEIKIDALVFGFVKPWQPTVHQQLLNSFL